jgi:hypothetical protein
MNMLVQQLTQTKLSIGIIAIVSTLLLGCFPRGMHRETRVAVAVHETNNDYGIDELDSYGVWISIPPYGRVWKPNVAREWTPFYSGHWDYTEPHWTWVSYEPFGWIVYHYGNWLNTPEEGWVWIPDNTEWSPANVQWIYYDDFVCWAPLPPRGIVWPRPWERYENRIDVWNVVHTRDFMRDNVGEHRIERSLIPPEEHRERIFDHSPDSKLIEQRTSQPIHSVKIERESVKVGKKEMHRMRVPQSDQQRAEKYKPQVESRVTRRSGERR